jgi:hypothetical protein
MPTPGRRDAGERGPTERERKERQAKGTRWVEAVEKRKEGERESDTWAPHAGSWY